MMLTKSPHRLFARVFLLLALAFLTGCAPAMRWTWQHPNGATDQQLQSAIADCDRIAWDEVNRTNYFPLWPYPSAYSDRFFFRHNYYYYYDDPFYASPSQRRYFDQQRFFRLCMESKGWRQVPLPPAK